MKLLIKHKFFEQIKNGEKHFEFRDAHFTFIDNITHETLRKEIEGVIISSKESIPFIEWEELTDEEKKEMFTDNKILCFALGDK